MKLDRKASDREYRERNKQKIAAKNAERDAKNPENARERVRKWREKNREIMNKARRVDALSPERAEAVREAKRLALKRFYERRKIEKEHDAFLKRLETELVES